MSAEVRSGACSEYEAIIEDYLSGQLPGAELKKLEGHLPRCPGCSAALERASLATRWLRLAEPSPEPGPAFARITMARIRQEVAASEQSKGFWQPFVALAWRFAATVTVVLALMVSFELAQHHRASPTTTAVAAERVNDMHYMFTADTEQVPANRDQVLLMVAENDHGNR